MGDNLQIVAMSATLPQLERVAQWLNASIFSSKFRPIALDERAVYQSCAWDKFGELVEEGLPTGQVTLSSHL